MWPANGSESGDAPTDDRFYHVAGIRCDQAVRMLGLPPDPTGGAQHEAALPSFPALDSEASEQGSGVVNCCADATERAIELRLRSRGQYLRSSSEYLSTPQRKNFLSTL
jgi:hypothetical protein